MNTPVSVVQKKRFGWLAWLGIACGVALVLAIVGIAASVVFGGKNLVLHAEFTDKKTEKLSKELSAMLTTDVDAFSDESLKNPSRAAANAMVQFSSGQFELVKEDDVKKRYTVKEKKSGQLTTLYWSEKTKSPETVVGDFSAIPADETGEAPAPVPAPAQN